MYVYLKCGNRIKKIPDVTLQECYKPQVGDLVEERIDPALWFKVLVLKAVFVDFDQRCVYWTVSDDRDAQRIYDYTGTNISKDKIVAFFNNTEPLLIEDCYDFDPNIDELFDTAKRAFDCLDLYDTSPEENLLKMLHVYILPKVKFSVNHSRLIYNVLELIEDQHEIIEDKIQKKDMTKKNTESSLKKQRDRILKNEDFSRSSYIATLSEKFLKVFLQHLEKDIRKMNDEFVSRGSEVEQLRGSIKKKEIEHLSVIRDRRDSLYEDLQTAIQAREEIKNVICRNHVRKNTKKSKRRSSHTVFHEVYMEVSMRLQGMSKEIQNLINIKIKLSSVREAVLLSVNELDSDGETYGYNRKKGSFEVEADLYDPHNKPEEWATLDEKVKMFLKAKQLGIRAQFEKFCVTIRDKCQRLFDDSKLFTISLPSPDEDYSMSAPISPSTQQTLNLLGAESQRRRSTLREISPDKPDKTMIYSRKDGGLPGPSHTQLHTSTSRRNLAQTYTSRWSFGTIPKESCENICQDIIEHLSAMATDLAMEMKPGQKEIPRSFICKVYICYEEHVSSQLMPVVNELYEHSYREKCQSLSRWIQQTPMSEFGFGEHVMANFLHLPSSESSSDSSSRENSSDIDEASIEDMVVNHPKGDLTKSLGNHSIKDMTLEQLYNYCDSQNEDLPPMYEGIMGNHLEASDTHPKQYLANLSDKQNGFGVEIGVECNPNDNFVIIPDSAANFIQGDNGPEPMLNDLDDCSFEEVTLRPKQTVNAGQPTHKSMLPLTVKQFCEQFKDFKKYLSEEDEAHTLFKKLRTLTQALKYIEGQIGEMRKGTGFEIQVCSDDLLDIIIMLLCQISPEQLLKLYSHMNLLMHLRPNFMDGSAHDYALITFCGAFQHLFEQKVLSNNTAQC